uniref:ATP synthase subunit a n=1 Tax=Phytophthora agathidicida TaxID=1642459 RepID=A0A7U3QS57_9STRA|nr:ATP synthase F0 subunit 6 [Phytophthora agathidicida]QPN53806.1 ATP synthase F0 subunit 6 [Phytophthora agathidicida]QTV76624.1 ATP synthase F0 subunit 6 [Phytophthora agathidicida]QTV76741.1 ATP synthase F0 subunit 6 [Phytophthora agathidicida]QTV76780.1 ATP synthase F0 subunit 6 [Phytophthora agathidicida]DAD54860.1 TPA_asm: ATP synthase F0 subunit 6 [Phytophthora agathidicida]
MFSPLEQFEILPIFQIPFVFTNASLILVIGLVYLYIFTNIKTKFIPTRFQQIFEMIFNVTIELTYSSIGKAGKHFVSLIFVVFFFILLCNLIGMVPYSFTVTSHLIITFTLALTIYIGFNIIGIKKHKLNFLNLLLPSGASIALVPILVPIELVSYIFRVISLPVRLFANMMAGHTLLKVITGFAWTMLNVNSFIFMAHFIPLIIIVLLVGLEIAVALIQAYVFTILTCMYINDALNLH